MICGGVFCRNDHEDAPDIAVVFESVDLIGEDGKKVILFQQIFGAVDGGDRGSALHIDNFNGRLKVRTPFQKASVEIRAKLFFYGLIIKERHLLTSE
jgi:hypothetical protein